MAEKYFGFHDIKIIESESHRDKDSCVRSIVEVFSVTLTVTVRRVNLEQIYNVHMQDQRMYGVIRNIKTDGCY